MSYQNAQALKSIGVECHALTLEKHPFEYAEQSKRVPRSFISNHFRLYNKVQIFHSCEQIFSLVKTHPNIIVYHTGTRYRDNPSKYNSLFNFRVKRCLTDQTEFMKLRAKDIAYIAPHIDLKPVVKRTTGKLIIGHFPSNPLVKGTTQIIDMLKSFKNDFELRIDTKILPHDLNLKRIAECHIYIELFKPELNGKPYGCYGVTAFEAAALGCKVVTNNLFPKVYEETYGSCAFAIANTREAFQETISSFKHLSPEELMTKPDFYDKHSTISTGKRILDLTS